MSNKVKIIEEAPGLDYTWLIHWKQIVNMEFGTLDEAIAFCKQNGVEWEVDYYYP